jgi:predicted alpha/beta-fold hydrolase
MQPLQSQISPGRNKNKMGLDTEVVEQRTQNRITEQAARKFLSQVERAFAAKPFQPHPLFTGGHAQTLAAYAWPRRFRQNPSDEARLFELAPDVKVLAHCRWQSDAREHPTIILWHGIEGSTSSVYMLAVAEKAFPAGFNIVRVNLRNCGGTEHLTPTLYHGGLSEDLRAVVSELIERDGLSRLFLIGFSLGGNLVLKLAGEYGDDAPSEVCGVCAVSPSVDLSASADVITQRSNWLYQRDFLRRLRKRMHIKKKLYPDLYDVSELHLVRSIREFDDRFTSLAHGFSGADDYYEKASSLPLLHRIRIPTLIIHAQDDPFIPFAPLRHPSVAANPYVLLVAPEQGGHVAFIARTSSRSDQLRDNGSPFETDDSQSEDRFWAENRAVEFCKLGNESLS